MVLCTLISNFFEMRPTMIFVVVFAVYASIIGLTSKSWKLSTLSLVIYAFVQVSLGLFFGNQYSLFIGTKGLILSCCVLIILQHVTVNNNHLKVKFLERDIRLMLLTFIGFYIYQFTYIHDRRGLMLFDETNFELLLVILPSSYLAYNGELRISTLFLLLGAVFLSGSRSALFCSVIVIVLALRRWKIFVLFLMPIFIAVLTKVNNRFSFTSIINSDRAQFFLTWVAELKDMGARELILGKGYWTALPKSLSSQWKYYEDLFYDVNNSIAYSVLYHSGVMRELRDFGILGASIMYFIIFYFLKKRFLGFAKFAMLIILLSGFSVTALGNVYLWIGLVFVVLNVKINSKREVHT